MNLGLWTPFLDEPDLFSWYQLPPDAQAECHTFAPNGSELDALPPEAFAAIHADTVRYANASVTELPYHNPTHFERVERAGLATAREIERLTGRAFPTAVLQNLRLALRLHDCHHSGSTFRADATSPFLLYRPALDANVATEWVSAGAAWDLAREHDLPVPTRLFQTQVIWSSTFGGHTERGAELGIPDVQPSGLWGCLMRAADVYPPSDFSVWANEGIAVTYDEVPAAPAPSTWQEFIANRIAFTGYIAHCLNQLDEAAGVLVTRELGWRHNLRQLRRTLQDMADGSAPTDVSAIQAQLAAHRVNLG